MAQIDSSIYFQQQSPDIMGSVERGRNMRAMADQRDFQKKQQQEQEALKKAYAVEKNPDGSMSLNKEKTLSQMAEINPLKAYEAQGQFQDQDRKSQEFNIKKQMQDLEVGSRVLWQVKDQASYDKAKQTMAALGRDTSKLPTAYDPSLIDQYKYATLTAKDRLTQKMNEQNYGLKNQELNIKRQELNIKRQKLSQEKSAAASPGQKKVDQEFAKDYNQWTSGGSNSARSEVNKLQGVVDRLKGGEVSTGGLTGALGDRFTSDAVLSARADVQSTVMNSLREILGPQFTEKEGERIIKNTWNEAEGTKNNVARLERLISDLNARANAKDKKAQYYEQTSGTLANYKAGSSQQGVASSPNNSSQPQPNSGGGMIPQANAGGKPQTIIQNGHTYTLNPATGEYE